VIEGSWVDLQQKVGRGREGGRKEGRREGRKERRKEGRKERYVVYKPSRHCFSSSNGLRQCTSLSP
jgi:hypothetical protein